MSGLVGVRLRKHGLDVGGAPSGAAMHRPPTFVCGFLDTFGTHDRHT